MNKTVLRALTIVGPTRENPVLDPLATPLQPTMDVYGHLMFSFFNLADQNSNFIFLNFLISALLHLKVQAAVVRTF